MKRLRVDRNRTGFLFPVILSVAPGRIGRFSTTFHMKGEISGNSEISPSFSVPFRL